MNEKLVKVTEFSGEFDGASDTVSVDRLKREFRELDERFVPDGAEGKHGAWKITVEFTPDD